MPGGRPQKFKSVKELQKLIDAYFDKADKNNEPYLITGLALALDTTRRTLLDYQNNKELKKFSHTIKKAKLRVENDYEKSLRANGKAGDIFGLKNFGWKDKTETALIGDAKNPLKIVIEVVDGNTKNTDS